jgi:dTDP-4-dehydrorhamnose reductase
MSHRELDITDESGFRDSVERAKPDLVINTAAFHNLPQCEKDVRTSFEVNARAPFYLGRACRDFGAKFVHISTDYVFGGSAESEPLREEDRPEPLSVYAASKLAGEHLVRQATDSHLIIRTCGLYGARGSSGKNGNFVLTMLKLGRERGEVRVVNDQTCAPTFAKHTATAIAALAETDQTGTFHAVNSGACTWYEFALEIFRVSGVSAKTHPVTSDEFFDGVRRPAYSVLDCSRYEKATGRELPSWRDGIREYLMEIGEIA